MIYFVFIDQTTGTFTVDGNESDQMRSSFMAQVKFFKELNLLLGAARRPRPFRFVWANNHANSSPKDISYYQELLTVRTRLGTFYNLQPGETFEHAVANYATPDKIYLVGGNVTGCMINTALPFNHTTLRTPTVEPTMVLDLCYDYIVPYNSDRELYSFLASACNCNHIAFTNSVSLKLELLR